MKDFTIDCAGCGAKCCKMLDRWMIFVKDFPYRYPGGVCEKLEDDRCTVYENRPYHCNVNTLRTFLKITDKQYKKLLKVQCEGINETWDRDKR